MAYVAIVDDDPTCLDNLRSACEAAGHVTDAYADPLVALPNLICVPPQVLILNGHMPGMDGVDFFLKFRQFSKAPVIFVSANADNIADTLFDLGASAEEFIDKPYSVPHVMRAVEALLRRTLAT